VDSYSHELKNHVTELAADPNNYVICLHFGVSMGSEAFNLEICGYNNANFCIPDSSGKTKTKEPIS
jgi:pyrrolidone-carboxylate peptidase